MACRDCYNGCIETVSDKCVKYTGIDVPLLGILKGDSLSYVEQAIITFLGSVLDGSGIKINLDESVYCNLVSQYLPTCQDVTALDLFKAIVQAACNLQEQVNTLDTRVDTIEANYTVNCLTGVTSTSGTHAIVQAVITKLCEINTSLAALSTNVSTNYVKISDLNSYIAAYLASQATATRYYTKMVPYTVVEYYGSLSFFDATGAGITNTEWEKIYLCNGLNGTPDKRGRVPVGAIVGVPGGSLAPAVDPAADPTFNPNYDLGDVAGANKVTLTIPQIPIHSHGVTDPGHSHVLAVNVTTNASPLTSGQYLAKTRNAATDNDYDLQNALSGTPNVGKVANSNSDISIQNTGSGQAHDNKQPALACYYIMYIP
jgi:microcystin-dependent protein